MPVTASLFADLEQSLSASHWELPRYSDDSLASFFGTSSAWQDSSSFFSPPTDRSVRIGSPRGSGRQTMARPMTRSELLKIANSNRTIWSGIIPPRNSKNSGFSCKVFLGGVPWDITEEDVIKAFGKFGRLRVEWPGIYDQRNVERPKGHLYLIFDHESSVKLLLSQCEYDHHHNQHNWFYRVSSTKMLVKSVQVIPWMLADATYSLNGYAVPSVVASSSYRIFVANLHGMITAEGLARIMNELFGGVVAATLDTDKCKYPIGSGRVTFDNWESHVKAICAGTVEIRTTKFTRQVKIDPYLEDSTCYNCGREPGPYFCRDMQCFAYFCRSCWDIQHSMPGFRSHQHITRPPRTSLEKSL